MRATLAYRPSVRCSAEFPWMCIWRDELKKEPPRDDELVGFKRSGLLFLLMRSETAHSGLLSYPLSQENKA